MPKQDSLQGSMDLLVLKLLARRAPLHGYAIMAAIKEIAGETLRMEEGSLYPALHRMEEAGWIKAAWVASENGRRVRGYSLTVAGQKHLQAVEAKWMEVTAAVSLVLRMA